MKLYHGTSEWVARCAVLHGLLPRSVSGMPSVWEEHPSSPDHIYLTVAYAAYFAMHATPEGERWAIIEIDSDLLPNQDSLMPDEDWLEQASRQQDLPESWGVNGAPMEARTKWFRENLWRFPHLWEDSIKGLGNCSYQGVIPPEAITRVSFVDPTGNPTMTLMSADPMITLVNYAVCQRKYQNILRWFMGDEVEVSAFIPGSGASLLIPAFLDSGLPLPPELERMVAVVQDQTESLRKVLSNRVGIEVS